MKKNPYGLENYAHPDQFGELIGYEVIRFDRKLNEATTQLKIRKDHLSPAGRVHGGVISAFLDFACGAAVFSTMGSKDYTSTVELKVNYLRPMELGDELSAETRVIFRGKRLCVTLGMLYKNGEKQPAALVTATYNVVTAP